MDGQEFLRQMERSLGTSSSHELAKALGVSTARLSGMRNQKLSALTLARLVAAHMQRCIKADRLIVELKRGLNVETDGALARKLGTTQNTFINWKNSSTGITARKISDLIVKAHQQATAEAHATAFRPVIEFMPIERYRPNKQFKVFNEGSGNKLRTGVRNELETCKGLYVFYDTRGRALYVGKAAKQSIWKEMHSAYNRPRRAQTIAIVNHPTTNRDYPPAPGKIRQPVDTPMKLVDLAAYFSAYEVAPALVDDFEALFIRAFPNDLLNYRMEKIGKKKPAAKARKSPRVRAAAKAGRAS